MYVSYIIHYIYIYINKHSFNLLKNIIYSFLKYIHHKLVLTIIFQYLIYYTCIASELLLQCHLPGVWRPGQSGDWAAGWPVWACPGNGSAPPSSSCWTEWKRPLSHSGQPAVETRPNPFERPGPETHAVPAHLKETERERKQKLVVKKPRFMCRELKTVFKKRGWK